jgi:putative serine protease PepD
MGAVALVLIAGLVGFIALSGGPGATHTPSGSAGPSVTVGPSESTLASPGPSESGGPSESSGPSGGGGDSTASAVAKVEPSVVYVEITGIGSGSGVIYTDSGYIITNAHVADAGPNLSVTVSRGGSSEGDSYPATLVGSNPDEDIAVIRISASGLVPADFGDSSKLAVGEDVLAIGNPLGLGSSVSKGIVSALNRDVPVGDSSTMTGLIQTDAPINPGNSGGALVDMQGHVIGITTLTLNPDVGSGIGWAIPSNKARTIADALIAANT